MEVEFLPLVPRQLFSLLPRLIRLALSPAAGHLVLEVDILAEVERQERQEQKTGEFVAV